MEEHNLLIAAIENKDIEEAKNVIRKHIDNQRKTILENLKIN